MASSQSIHTCRFDVFLSFRGEDTRHSFTDHLYSALKRRGIPTFRDNEEIGRGQDLEPEIVKAIKESKASIVVLSENYAKSRWCLNELTLILEQRRECNHFVLPVFYGVDPSDVRNQRKSFDMEGSKWTEYNMKTWKAALSEVANLTGMVASGSETEFIAKIVDTVYCKLDLKLLGNPAHLTGMDVRASGINSWLKSEQSSINILAICGMGGIGKTTVARYIYDLNKHSFENSSFLEEIGEHHKQPSGLLGLQKQLLTDILGGNMEGMCSVYEGATKIEEALQKKRVLLVLDDIDDNDQLAALLGIKEFHTQSKIIITTRRLDIHVWFASISRRCQVHSLDLLNDDESLELFSCHAFGSKIPMEGFKELAVDLAEYCEGNPLALKVLGSSLFVSDEEKSERNKEIEIWRSRLNSLSPLNGNLDCKIQGVLQKSFDSLPLPIYKELFLHIATFFVGEDEDYVVKILEHDWHAKVGIMTLINRCLLSISSRKKLMMHQLLQDMGRHIVSKESKDPAKRNSVWCSDEAYHVLAKGDGSETIEGLALDLRKLKKGTKVLALKTSSLAKMHKLKLLQLNFVQLSGSYKNFPELRWLCWHGCVLKTIPSSLLTSSLVTIDMSNGKLKKFEPPVVLSSLKVLNLFRCTELVCIHNLCRVPNLETLILWNCYRLTHICNTIAGLESLALLNLRDCKKLWKVLSNQKYVNQLERIKSRCLGGGVIEQPFFPLPQSLKYLFLDYCSVDYNNDVHVVSHGQPLYGMSLEGNLFEFLPNNIDLKMLRVLNLNYCKNLKSLLCLPTMLEELYTYRCESLVKVTFQSARYRLRKFAYEGCLKLYEIQGLIKLVSIKKLAEADLGRMKWIKVYQDQKVDLIGDAITKGRIWHIQMMYEYGIMSTYLPGIKDLTMTSDYMTSSAFLSFVVPLCPTKGRIQGLDVISLYRSSGFKNKDMWVLCTKIRNITKDLTWIYYPLVYCKPIVGEYVVWLSYWPIGNILDAGDEVCVEIIVEEGLIVSKCGASLVYMEGEVEQAIWDSNTEMKEVIGGDLSEFELTTGVYYLCRRDFLKSNPDLSSWSTLFGDTVHCTDLQGWRRSHQSLYLDLSCMELSFSPLMYTDTLNKEVWLGEFDGKFEISKIKKVVSRLAGVDYVYYDKELKQLCVSGTIESMAVETCVREFDDTVTVMDIYYKLRYLLTNFPMRKYFILRLPRWTRKYTYYSHHYITYPLYTNRYKKKFF